MTAPTYTPEPGHQVVVRRYEVPCPELPGYAERKLTLELEGTIATVRGLSGGHLITLEGAGCDPIFTGYQFSGQDPEHGCSWSLRTVVIPAGEVEAYDTAELAAKVAQAEREHAAALALWEQARDAELVAKQRLIGAQERLEATQRQETRARLDREAQRRQRDADLDAAWLAGLTERRKPDRAAMAEHVAELARAYGLVAGIIPERAGSRETKVAIAGPHTLALTVAFRGDSPQCEPDTYVLSWHMRPWADEGKDYRLAAAFCGSVNLQHADKATDVAGGFRALVELLTQRFASIADGSAFAAAVSTAG
jgi:hypothetical protein